ncbi:MAG TPA: RICIN domain-containing protein [Streptosporangiaceae bacterium]
MPMLAGIAVTLLLAGGGATAYVLAFHQPATRHASPLPSRAISTTSVGLVVTAGAPGTAGEKLFELVDTRASLPEFSPLTAAEAAAGSPQWTAALMGGNTYIFIFLASDTCLTAIDPGGRPALAMRHCNLTTRQRWRRATSGVIAAGHDYFQFVNTGDGMCLTITGRQADGGYGTGLAPCTTPPPASQLIAFWWSSA